MAKARDVKHPPARGDQLTLGVAARARVEDYDVVIGFGCVQVIDRRAFLIAAGIAV